MSGLRIVADSSMDMPAGWDRDYDIHILPVNIQFADQSFRQGIDIGFEQFYRMVRELRIIPKTSLPSTGQIKDFYRSIARRGDEILSLHVASRMSGTFNAVKLAASELTDEFRIYPYDSGNGSAGLAFMAREARLMERAGRTMQEILKRMDAIRKQISIVLTLDSLEFAQMSGRVTAFQARLSSLLQVKPIIFLRDGMLDIADRVRTRKKSIEKVIELTRQHVGEKLVNIAVVHAIDPESASEMVLKVKNCFRYKEIIMTDLSISVAANLGPRTIGIVAYPVVEDE